MCLAVPGRIVAIEGDDSMTRLARVSFGGVVKQASLAFLPEARVGDYVLIHVGVAISRLDEDEALEQLEYLRQIDELAEVEGDS